MRLSRSTALSRWPGWSAWRAQHQGPAGWGHWCGGRTAAGPGGRERPWIPPACPQAEHSPLPALQARNPVCAWDASDSSMQVHQVLSSIAGNIRPPKASPASRPPNLVPHSLHGHCPLQVLGPHDATSPPRQMAEPTGSGLSREHLFKSSLQVSL